jgi:hypothetical protein
MVEANTVSSDGPCNGGQASHIAPPAPSAGSTARSDGPYAEGKHPALYPCYHWFTSAARPSDDGTWGPHIFTLPVAMHPKLICKAVPGPACERISIACRLYSADNLD